MKRTQQQIPLYDRVVLIRDPKEETAIVRKESLGLGTFSQSPWGMEHFHRIPGGGNFFTGTLGDGNIFIEFLGVGNFFTESRRIVTFS